MGLDVPGRAEMYFPYRQVSFYQPRDLAIRTAGEPTAIASAVRQAIQAVDTGQPVANVRTMEEVLRLELSQRDLQVKLLGSFAALALILAALGIYGVLAYTVTHRTQEIGIRMALGASQRDVLQSFVRQGMALTAIGVGVGLAASFALTRLMTALLYGVTPSDPLTYGGVSALLLLVAIAASYLPARRATKVDPMVALRYE
jgi:ABC-type antimicrobial peptide transport system permease subunit